MSSLNELILRGNQTAVRRAYIKRRLVSGSYESNWLRIDNYGGVNRVISYGSISQEIDHVPGQPATFNVSQLGMVFDNQEGYFNVETDTQSIWSPESTYLNRKFTKLKVLTAYKDDDGSEVGAADIFEGYVDRVTIGEDQLAKLSIVSYQAILQKYPISDLAMTGSKTVSQIVTIIMNQAKITQFIPYIAPNPPINPTVVDTALLTGTYWDVIQDLAFQSNSIPLILGSVWSFSARTPGAVVWNFKGAGTYQPDIFNVSAFDDEGAENVRLYWKAKDSSIKAVAVSATLLSKYLSDPVIMDLSNYSDADKQVVLDENLSEFLNNRPVIEFSSRFFVNQIKPLDSITIKIFGQILPLGMTGRWGLGVWGGGLLWGRAKGAVNIIDGSSWMVTRIVKDIDSWQCSIKAVKIV